MKKNKHFFFFLSSRNHVGVGEDLDVVVCLIIKNVVGEIEGGVGVIGGGRR
jgi:hypothetical protein